jgi:hypothetical protein
LLHDAYYVGFSVPISVKTKPKVQVNSEIIVTKELTKRPGPHPGPPRQNNRAHDCETNASPVYVSARQVKGSSSVAETHRAALRNLKIVSLPKSTLKMTSGRVLHWDAGEDLSKISTAKLTQTLLPPKRDWIFWPPWSTQLL